MGHGGMAVLGTPFRMARNVRPAFADSDHGGNVRFAGGGFIPSRLWPRPSPPAPWQMAQWAANRTPPACRTSGDDSSPAGALGVLRSHPEMTSEIVKRATPARSFRFSNHSVSKALHLADNGSDKLIEPIVDGARANHRQVDDLGHEPQQRNRGRVAVDQPRRLEQ